MPLFNGKNLNNWEIVGGNATYKIVDDVIIGTSQLNTPNTFLTTKQHFTDFILELEYKVDPLLNSGIQIRSNSIQDYYNGRVHGYQIEIDPSERSWSAGIYDEARRGWLFPLTKNPEAQKAFKQGEWNAYRIEAIGDTIKTWINGIAAAHLIDDLTPKGFIGLQVHSIGKDSSKLGTQVAWRNIKILTDDLHLHTKKSSVEAIKTKNNLTMHEANSGWKMLWDGSTLNGWEGVHSKDVSSWTIEDGELKVSPSNDGQDIITTKTYKDFELKLEFKLTEGANSGIKYYANQFDQGESTSFLGLEFQLLDDTRHPDAHRGEPHGSRTAGALYDIFAPDTSKFLTAIGQWNHAHIVSKNNTVTHWLNHIKILEYERGSEALESAIENSKFKGVSGFGTIDSGHILLQDHDSEVFFRNIKIKEIN